MKWLKFVVATLVGLEVILIVPLASEITYFWLRVGLGYKIARWTGISYGVACGLAIVSLCELVILFLLVKIGLLPRLLWVIGTGATTVVALAAVAVLLIPTVGQ